MGFIGVTNGECQQLEPGAVVTLSTSGDGLSGRVAREMRGGGKAGFLASTTSQSLSLDIGLWERWATWRPCPQSNQRKANVGPETARLPPLHEETQASVCTQPPCSEMGPRGAELTLCRVPGTPSRSRDRLSFW